MNIGCTMAPGRGDTDLLLHALANRLIGRGLRVCGTVQINSERADAGPCDMDVKILPQGRVLRISQTLGRSSRGCRLNAGALESAVGLVEAALDEGADLLIVNKFGKHEAEGRGFRNVIAEAVARDIPVLVGMNGLNAPAFETFTGGCATRLEPNRDVLWNWCVEAVQGAMPPERESVVA